MTRDSSRKRAVRDRMARTGEKYTEALRAIRTSEAAGIDPFDHAERWLLAHAPALRESIQAATEQAGWRLELDDVDQIELVEGGMHRGTLESFVADPTTPIELTDAVGGPGPARATATVRGAADVAWLATAFPGNRAEEDAIATRDDDGFVEWPESGVPVDLVVRWTIDEEAARPGHLDLLGAVVPTDEVIERIRLYAERTLDG